MTAAALKGMGLTDAWKFLMVLRIAVGPLLQVQRRCGFGPVTWRMGDAWQQEARQSDADEEETSNVPRKRANPCGDRRQGETTWL